MDVLSSRFLVRPRTLSAAVVSTETPSGSLVYRVTSTSTSDRRVSD
jgi:hypothetical protein